MTYLVVWCVVLCCVVSCRVVCLVVCRVVWCGVVSCRVASCRVASCRVVSCRVVSCRVVSCVVLCYVVLCWVGLCHQVAVDLREMVDLERLRHDNDMLEQQVSLLSQFQPEGLMPCGVMHSKEVRRDSRRQSETQSQDALSHLDGTVSHLSETGEEVALPPTGSVGGGTVPRPPSPINEKLLKEKNDLERSLKDAETRWKQEAIQRKKLFNELQDVKGKIRVMARARPFKPEVEEGKIELEFVDEYTMQVPPPPQVPQFLGGRMKFFKRKKFWTMFGTQTFGCQASAQPSFVNS